LKKLLEKVLIMTTEANSWQNKIIKLDSE